MSLPLLPAVGKWCGFGNCADSVEYGGGVAVVPKAVPMMLACSSYVDSHVVFPTAEMGLAVKMVLKMMERNEEWD